MRQTDDSQSRSVTTISFPSPVAAGFAKAVTILPRLNFSLSFEKKLEDGEVVRLIRPYRSVTHPPLAQASDVGLSQISRSQDWAELSVRASISDSLTIASAHSTKKPKEKKRFAVVAVVGL